MPEKGPESQLTTVRIPIEQHDYLKRVAELLDTSMAELVREGITRYINELRENNTLENIAKAKINELESFISGEKAENLTSQQ